MDSPPTNAPAQLDEGRTDREVNANRLEMGVVEQDVGAVGIAKVGEMPSSDSPLELSSPCPSGSVDSSSPSSKTDLSAPPSTECFKCLDFRWSLFISALRSYRWTTTLKPLPPQLRRRDDDVDDELEEKDYLNVVRLCDGVDHRYTSSSPFIFPPPTSDSLSPSTSIDLPSMFEWVTTTGSSAFNLTSSTDVENVYADICREVGQPVDGQVPLHIFRINYCENSSMLKRFEALVNSGELPKNSSSQLTKDDSIVSAFHGSPLENFYSILHFGLSGHMGKRNVFGDGIYLAGDLGVALHFSSTGATWSHTSLGAGLRCVAVCDVINRPRLTVTGSGRGAGLGLSALFRNRVPVKYYVVKNSHAVKVKYILVYGDLRGNRQAPVTDPRTNKGPNERLRNSVSFRLASWMRQNSFLTLLLLYVAFLVLLGLDSKSLYKMFKKMFRFY